MSASPPENAIQHHSNLFANNTYAAAKIVCSWYVEAMTGRIEDGGQDKGAACVRAKRLRALSFAQAAGRGAGRHAGRAQWTA
jgi:hypothetical protein